MWQEPREEGREQWEGVREVVGALQALGRLWLFICRMGSFAGFCAGKRGDLTYIFEAGYHVKDRPARCDCSHLGQM